MNKTELVVLFGATGKTGFHIANSLIDSGYAVRIVVRNKAKVTQLFQEKEISFEKIIEGQLNSHEVLKAAFEPSEPFGKVKYVVSALGKTMGDKESSVQQIEYLTQVRLMDYCKQTGILKYIFITAALMERPWNAIAILLNTLVPNIYHWKAKAENHLRRSGLNYCIVRPPGLVGDEKDLTVTPYSVDQGDHISGRITRCTLGNVIKDVISCKQIADKVTFECVGVSQQEEHTYATLKPDTKNSIVKANHKTPKRVCGLTLVGLFGMGTYFLGLKFLAA